MKLSKNDILVLLNSYVHGNRMGELKEDAQKLIDKLLHNELEIEGYERDEWIKYDPDNQDTFPPAGQNYLCYNTADGEVSAVYRSDKCTDEMFASLSHDMEYWRPFPKPSLTKLF